GRQTMHLAHARSEQANQREAGDLFQQAGRMFSMSGDIAEAAFAEYWSVLSYAPGQGKETSLRAFERLAEEAKAQQFKWLHVRALYGLSSLHFARNEHSEAINSARQAVVIASQIDDKAGLINPFSALIVYHRYLGNFDQALGYVETSLPLLNQVMFEPNQVWRYYSILASTLHSAQLHALALAYQSEAVAIATQSGAFDLL